jgi:hypothetical protein
LKLPAQKVHFDNNSSSSNHQITQSSHSINAIQPQVKLTQQVQFNKGRNEPCTINHCCRAKYQQPTTAAAQQHTSCRFTKRSLTSADTCSKCRNAPCNINHCCSSTAHKLPAQKVQFNNKYRNFLGGTQQVQFRKGRNTTMQHQTLLQLTSTQAASTQMRWCMLAHIVGSGAVEVV